MGFDPYLQSTTFKQRICSLTGFAQRVRTGYYGSGRQVQAPTVTGAITAIGQTISLAIGHNPTKIIGSDKFLPALQVMIDGFSKDDPPTRKMLPVESDVPELLVKMGYGKLGTAHTRAVGDLALIAFYFLLRLASTPSKANAIIQSKRYNSNWRTSLFTKKRGMDNYVVSLKTHLPISYCPPIVQPSN